MIDYTKKYELSAKDIVSNMLPFFIRGKKLLSFIMACIKPMESTNTVFRVWMQERFLETKLNFQKRPMEIYLKSCLGEFFKNSSDEFKFDLYAHKNYNWKVGSADNESNGFSVTERGSDAVESMPTFIARNYCYSTSEVTGKSQNKYNLSAPMCDVSKISEEDYMVKIQSIVSKYSIIRKYNIVLQDII